MINVDSFKQRVQDLLRKGGKGGFISPDEFNRDLIAVQNVYMDYVLSKFDSSQEWINALSPFVVETQLPVINQYVTIPDDYRQRLEVGNRQIS